MSAVLRAKMYVTVVENYPSEKNYQKQWLIDHPDFVIEKTAEQLYLAPVYEEDGINKEWSEATPSGSLSLFISNKNAWGRVKEGDYVFVDITPTTREG